MPDQDRDARIRAGDTETHIKALERKEQAKLAVWRARARLVGAIVFGSIGLWRLAGASEFQEIVTWGSFCAVAVGIASFDQILKAIGK